VPSGRRCAKSFWVGPGEGDLITKAFVKETDGEDDLPDEPLAIPAGVKNYMTPEGHCRMDKIRLIPGHCDPTVNLYDWLSRPRHEGPSFRTRTDSGIILVLDGRKGEA